MNKLDGSAELATYMDRDHIGSGCGSDVQRAIIGFGFDILGLERIWLTADADKTREVDS